MKMIKELIQSLNAIAASINRLAKAHEVKNKLTLGYDESENKLEHNLRVGMLGDHCCDKCGRTEEDIEDNGGVCAF